MADIVDRDVVVLAPEEEAAESKSTYFVFDFNAFSEKSSIFHAKAVNRLAGDSE
jgi:hypothetical protein